MTAFYRNPGLFIATTISHGQETAVDLFWRHPHARIVDYDPVILPVPSHMYFIGVGIPCIRDDLGQNRRDVAVEIDAEMLQDVEADRQCERRSWFRHDCLSRCALMDLATARANSTGTAFPMSLPTFLKWIVRPGEVNS